MNKTLRIVAKDIRHLRLEILLSFAFTFAFAWLSPFAWRGNRGAFREAEVAVVWANILMAISWFLLLSRVVHDESLVGDRQVWITRPYGWRRLLVAKFFFIAAFILLPLFLADCSLLSQAHILSSAAMLLVLKKIAFTFLFFFLPLIALATVTATVNRMFITLLALAVYSGFAAYFDDLIHPGSIWTPGEDIRRVAVTLIAIVVLSLSVIVLQYARRQTRISVALLVVLVLIITGTALSSMHHRGNLGQYSELAPGEAAPFQLRLGPPSYPHALNAETEDSAALPVITSGVAPGHHIRVDGVSIEESNAAGQTFTLPWNAGSRFDNDFMNDQPAIDLDLQVLVSQNIGRQLGNVRTLTVTYAVAELEPGVTTTVPASLHMNIPQNGYCSELSSPGDIGCFYAVQVPAQTLVSYPMQQVCGAASPRDFEQRPWVRGPSHTFLSALFDQKPFDPVTESHLEIDTHLLADGADHSIRIPAPPPVFLHLCPGAPITFTQYHVTRRRLVHVTFPNVDLNAYAPERKPTEAHTTNND